MGNDSRDTKARCFDTFPFPAATDSQAAALRALAEAIDLYNAVEALRAGRALTAKEQAACLTLSPNSASFVQVMDGSLTLEHTDPDPTG